MRHVLALAILLPFAGHAHAKGSPVPPSDLKPLAQDYSCRCGPARSTPLTSPDGWLWSCSAASLSHQTLRGCSAFDLLGHFAVGFTVAGLAATGTYALWTYLARSP